MKKQPLPEDTISGTLRQQLTLVLSWTRGHIALDPANDLSRMQRLLATNLRVFFLVARFDVYKKLELHAQALTMKTLLALVPLLTVLFASFRSFAGLGALQTQVESFITSVLSPSPEQTAIISGYLGTFVGNLENSRLGLLSIAILLLTVMSLLSHIEASFNTLFGVTQSRSLGSRFLTYWALLTLGPALLAGSLALTAYLQSGAFLSYLGSGYSMGVMGLRALPLLLTWAGFAIVYFVVPNARVKFSAAISAAVVAGSMWNIAKAGFAIYAKHNMSAANIYGSMAVFPLFILWLYLSWLLLLFGIHLCFAFQHALTQVNKPASGGHPCFADFELACCRLLLWVADDFSAGRKPTLLSEAAAQVGIDASLLQRVTRTLEDGGWIRLVDEGAADHGAASEKVLAVPARPLAQISLSSLREQLRNDGEYTIDLRDDWILNKLKLAIKNNQSKSCEDLLMQD